MREAVGILLAAGRATRFGGDKLLYRLRDGTPMAVAAAMAMGQALGRVVAVIREEGALGAALREIGAETLVCPTADRGMGASLAYGVAATGEATGWIVGLADMPFIEPATIGAVAEALRRGAAIAAPVLPDGRRGHPVGFAAEWRPALGELDGDLGARELLRTHSARLRLVPTSDAGCIRDVDRRLDLAP